MNDFDITSSKQKVKKKLSIARLIIIVFIVFPIGAIIAFFIISYGENKALDIIRTTDITYIRNQFELYFDDHKSFPSSLAELVPRYLNEMPKDPKTNKPYTYKQINAGQDYELCYDSKCFNSLYSNAHSQVRPFYYNPNINTELIE